jgi:hypothetical protein
MDTDVIFTPVTFENGADNHDDGSHFTVLYQQRASEIPINLVRAAERGLECLHSPKNSGGGLHPDHRDAGENVLRVQLGA